ncbi:hypothetical protein QFZ79_003402 [Arthrobacter sp. V4I6]|uniref:hypothetical protein n=1 Tax=unclassified Arthrobacter TaxID=235627 RepID=UPI00277FA129|nr:MULTISPECIES: hypothetical protein [unclassified Arthrobacter]MDQ0821030.1 hypothetical protein [Arthrobacter sp. V1I7]MDQ0855291.1 hypothetical protein [Arthrobacter sp. V4I6]
MTWRRTWQLALLAAGSASPALKAEIIALVIRFRVEKQRSEVIRPQAVTRTFDYDTTDPRSRNPYYADKNHRQARKNRARRVNFGSTPSALQFGKDMAALREDVDFALADADKDPSFLLDRIVKLYRARKRALNSNYEHEVGDELDGMAISVAGTTAREATAHARPAVRFYKPVPDEVSPIFSKQVVSGGLPTLGRGRR